MFVGFCITTGEQYCARAVTAMHCGLIRRNSSDQKIEGIPKGIRFSTPEAGRQLRVKQWGCCTCEQ